MSGSAYECDNDDHPIGCQCPGLPPDYYTRGKIMADFETIKNAGETRITSSTGGQKGTKFQRPALIPADVLLDFSQIYTIGAEKYDDNNWRKGYSWHLSMDAAQRHLLSFIAGEDYDTCKCETGVPVRKDGAEGFPCADCGATGQKHILQCAWHCFTLAWYMDHKREFDDRAARFDEEQVEIAEFPDAYPLVNLDGIHPRS